MTWLQGRWTDFILAFACPSEIWLVPNTCTFECACVCGADNSYVFTTHSCLHELVRFWGVKDHLRLYELEVILHMSNDTIACLAYVKRAELYWQCLQSPRVGTIAVCIVHFCQAVSAEELERKSPMKAQGILSANSMCLHNGVEYGPEMEDWR